MAHIHGKNAVLYLGAGGSAASKVAELVDWSLDFDSAFVDVSPLGNTWKQAVKGMLGFTGAFNGNYNSASVQLWTASLSDVPEKFYLYPTAADTSKYYYGTAWVALTKIAAGSTTSKAASGIKIQGDDTLSYNA